MEHVRVDSGYKQGQEIPIYYDPMIAKLIVYAENRPAAIALLKQAIDAYKIEGIATTLSFGSFVADHEAFTSGNFDTGFVPQYYSNEKFAAYLRKDEEIGAHFALWAYLESNKQLKIAKRTDDSWLSSRK